MKESISEKLTLRGNILITIFYSFSIKYILEKDVTLVAWLASLKNRSLIVCLIRAAVSKPSFEQGTTNVRRRVARSSQA